MKLRIRSLETKQTHRIQVPDPCSFHQLKQIIFQTLNPQILSSSSIETLHLSLNRRDELQRPSPDDKDTLQSLGITSGDLIFFTLNPAGFSAPSPQFTLSPSTNLQSENTPPQVAEHSSINSQITPQSSGNLQSKDTQKEVLIGEEEKVVDGGDFVEFDGKGDVNNYASDSVKSFSVPGFLRNVFTEELGNEGGRDHELLVIAIHAVLLESGLVGFDPLSKTEIKGSQFRSNWPTGLFALSLYYTLPEMITSNGESELISTAVLKFQCLGKYMTVYGALLGPNSVVHSVKFDEKKLVPFLNVAWANCGFLDEVNVGEGISRTSAEKEVFEFWSNVKDGLALPLLIDLCEKSGSVLRCSFMGLPTELKMKILELLPGPELAKISLCRELRYLSSSDDLWRKKYVEQFGDAARASEDEHWRQKFVNRWKSQNRKRILEVPHHGGFRPIMPRRMPPIIGGDHDMWPRGVIGGDYDLFPQPFGALPPSSGLSVSGGMPLTRRLRLASQVPHCNLGGSGNRTLI